MELTPEVSTPPAAVNRAALPKLDHALTAVRARRYVFPCVANGKKPAVKNWQEWATLDEAKIIAHWKKHPDHNIGWYLGKPGAAVTYAAIDVDKKPGKDGNDTLVRLELEGFEMPDTLEHGTPSGGRHIIFSCDEPVAPTVGKLGPGVDTRSAGSYILAPGSTTADGSYTVTVPLPVARAPAWLPEKCGAARTRRAKAPAMAIAVDQNRANERARRYLETDAPLTDDPDAYIVACRVKDFGVTEDDAIRLMQTYWDPRCDPPRTDNTIDPVRNAYRYGQEPQGASAPEADFTAQPANQKPPPAWLEKMNARYAVTTHHNRTMVHEVIQDPELGYPRHSWLAFDDLRSRHQSEKVKTVDWNSGRPMWKGVGTAWLDHEHRRQYRHEAFLPGEDAPADVLNLWNGFAVEPKPGDWSKMRSHIEQVICGGDTAAFSYVMGWMARLVQRPSEPGQVALVLQGDEGAGKGTFVTALLGLFGQHGIHIAAGKHLTGAFNSHLRDKVLVFADEAVFAGDPEHKGALYALITESKIQIEAKGVDAKIARNVLHVVMATNEDWAVPAGPNARRFCVLGVSDRRRQDIPYFDAIRAEMARGGLSAMLHDLLAIDLKNFDVFALPQTEALAQQKIQSLKGPAAWLYGCLTKRAISCVEWTDKPLDIDRSEAYNDYARDHRRFKDFAPIAQNLWARKIRSILGPCFDSIRPRAGEKRQRHYQLAGILDCREAFDRYIGGKNDWGD